jgi:hypothetical protein
MNYRVESISEQAAFVARASLLARNEHKQWSVPITGNGAVEFIAANIAGALSVLAVMVQSVNHRRTSTVISDWDQFQIFAAQWRKERSATSSITKMAACPAYHSIMGMGPKAVPLILRQLESEGDDPDHWFWALQRIAQVDPVNADDRGDMKRMAKAWINWGRQQGYAW